MATEATSDQSSDSNLENEDSSLSDIEFNISPFELYCVFGHNAKEVPPLNLTTHQIDRTPRMAYAASNILVITRGYEEDAMYLRGHRNFIALMCSDKTGRWIASSDRGKDNALIIWDTLTGVPVHTLFDVYEDGCDFIELSPCGKYLITASNSDRRTLQLWEWVFGHEEPDESICFDDDFGDIKKITLSPDKSEFLIVTFQRHIVFLLYEDGKFCSYTPNINDLWTKKLDNVLFTDSTFIEGDSSYNSVTVSNYGVTILWSHKDRGDPNTDIGDPADIIKKKISCIFYLPSKNITAVCSSNKIVITCDSRGVITFYNDSLELLCSFTNFNVGWITFIHLDRQSIYTGKQLAKKISDAKKLRELEDPYNLFPPYSQIKTNNFLVTTKKGLVGYVDVSYEKITYLLQPFSPPTCIESHPTDAYFCVGTAGNSVKLVHYETKIILREKYIEDMDKIPCKKLDPTKTSVSCLKYRPDGAFLVCGKENGQVWILAPLTLDKLSTGPLFTAKGGITCINFSDDLVYMAIADSKMHVALFTGTCHCNFLGEYRSHYKPIIDLIFLSQGEDCELYSIGEDRSLAEYDLQKSVSESTQSHRYIAIKCIYRIDQCGIPLCMLPYPEAGLGLLLCNSLGKFRIIDNVSKKCIKTAQEPILPYPIHRIKILPPVKDKESPNYFVYAAGNYIGIQKTPLDGNPYRTISILGSVTDIKDIRCSYDGSYVYHISSNDKCIYVWKTFKESVDILEHLGGSGLEPYYCMLEGGKYGSFMNDIKDFFYYCQIIHEGENLTEERPVFHSLPLCEIADFMRALGFYPSDYDVTNMLHEIGCDSESDQSQLTKRIQFEDLVILYINHRWTTGITEKNLRNAFETFAIPNKNKMEGTINPTISRNNFFAILEDTGEMLNRTEILNYLNALLSTSDDCDSSTSPSLPHEITYDFLCDEILCTWRTEPKEKDTCQTG